MPYRPYRGEGELQTGLTFLVLSTVLLKGDLKDQKERTGRLRPQEGLTWHLYLPVFPSYLLGLQMQ